MALVSPETPVGVEEAVEFSETTIEMFVNSVLKARAEQVDATRKLNELIYAGQNVFSRIDPSTITDPELRKKLDDVRTTYYTGNGGA